MPPIPGGSCRTSAAGQWQRRRSSCCAISSLLPQPLLLVASRCSMPRLTCRRRLLTSASLSGSGTSSRRVRSQACCRGCPAALAGPPGGSRLVVAEPSATGLRVRGSASNSCNASPCPRSDSAGDSCDAPCVCCPCTWRPPACPSSPACRLSPPAVAPASAIMSATSAEPPLNSSRRRSSTCRRTPGWMPDCCCCCCTACRSTPCASAAAAGCTHRQTCTHVSAAAAAAAAVAAAAAALSKSICSALASPLPGHSSSWAGQMAPRG